MASSTDKPQGIPIGRESGQRFAVERGDPCKSERSDVDPYKAVVLIVSAVALNRELLAAIIRSFGFKVISCATVVEARRQKPADVLVIDDQAMRSNDPAACWRGLDDFKVGPRTIPIFLCRNRPMLPLSDSFRTFRFTGYILKPFRIGQIETVLKPHVRRPSPASIDTIETKDDLILRDRLKQAASYMDAETLTRALNLFETELRNLSDPAVCHDMTDAARRAHTLISSACIFGFSDLGEACKVFETAVRETKDPRSGYRDLSRQLESALSLLTRLKS